MENHKPVLIVIAGPNGSGKTISRYTKYIDRTYVYDNSIDDKEAALLFRKLMAEYSRPIKNPYPIGQSAYMSHDHASSHRQ
jgi:predicted ABC-type ATPase